MAKLSTNVSAYAIDLDYFKEKAKGVRTVPIFEINGTKKLLGPQSEWVLVQAITVPSATT